MLGYINMNNINSIKFPSANYVVRNGQITMNTDDQRAVNTLFDLLLKKII